MTEGSDHLNRFGGSASAEAVVQAGEVHGGVHIHSGTAAPVPVPHQLRADVGHFVNRGRELERLGRLLPEAAGAPATAPLAVVTGSAGVGKTSLVLRWAHSVRRYFSDGELYVDLRAHSPGPPRAPHEVLGRFLEDLGVPPGQVPAGPERRETTYRSLLADRRLLIVLDNAASSAQVRPLLPGAGGCLVVVTSRDDLPGLVTREGALRVEVTTLPPAEAVALLRAATAGYRPRDRRTDLLELAALCAGLPLALRIAAERAAGRPATALGELIAALRDEGVRSHVLTAEEADDEGGSGAMRSVFEWSYRALPDPAARLFRLLGLHPGAQFGLPAVAALAGVAPAQAHPVLESLVRAHLLERRSEERYAFHNLLRAYAADQVGRADGEAERAAALGRCLAWYLYTACAAQQAISPYDSYRPDGRVPAPPGVLDFDGYDAAFGWYRSERANLVEATRSAAENGFPEVAWRLAVVLRAVYMHHNAFDDWVTTARIGVTAAVRTGEQEGEAEALENLGKAVFQALHLDEAEECHRAALAIRRRLGDRRGIGVSTNALGLLALRRRRLDEAREHFAAGAEAFDSLGDRRWAALLRGNLAEVLCELGRWEEAAGILEPTLPYLEQLADSSGRGNGLYLLSRARRELGDLAAASRAIDTALDLARREDNQMWRGYWLLERARVTLAEGDPEGALRQCRESAAVQRRLGDAAREAAAVDAEGEVCRALGLFAQSAALHRRAVGAFRRLDAGWQLAVALEGWSVALAALGDRAAARAAGEEALRLLGAFADPPAAVRAGRVAGLLAELS